MRYIGARYVPLIIGEWDKTKSYEPLSVVVYQGNSYTSKKNVPVGVEIDNTDYWARTGNYNQQIEQMYNEWEEFHADVNTLLRDYAITPEMYGAKGDGVTDDTNAFKSCFADVGSNNSLIVIPAKTYKLTDSISIYPNTRVICNGEIEYSLINKGQSLFELNGDNIYWHGGVINGTGALSSYVGAGCVFHSNTHNNIFIEHVKITNTPCTYAIMFEHCDNIIINNAYIKEYTYGGICFNEGCSNSIVQNSMVINGHEVSHDNRYAISLSLYANTYANYPLAKNISVLNNFIEDETPYWEGIDAHGGTELKIIGNVIKNTFTGVTVFGSEEYACNNIEISNNIIILPKSGTEVNKNNNGITLNTCDNIIINNNIIENAGFLNPINNRAGCGFSLTICSNLIANNNHIKNCNCDGIYMTECNHLIINDNVIEGNSKLSQYFIEYVGVNTHTTVNNNIVYKYPRAVYGGSGDGSTRNYLKGNKYDEALDLSNVNYIIPDILPLQGLIVNIKTGAVGDIILNGQVSAGNTIGWVCTKEGTDSEDAIWTPLANA